MNSSGIKRGLAVAAVSALGVVGIPAAASATSLPAQNGGADSSTLSFYTGGHGYASTKSGASVHLLAAGGGAVKQVKFSYQVGSEPAVTITTVTSSTNDSFGYNWTPPAGIAGATVTLTAQGLDASGTPVGDAETTSVTVGTGQEPVTVTNAAGSSVGIYNNPTNETPDYKGIVSGSVLATASTGTPLVGVFSAATTAVGADNYTAPTGTTPVATSFSGIADFGDYSFDTATTGAVDEAVVGAYGAGTPSDDDEQAVKVYKQQVKGITPDAAVKSIASTDTTGASSTVTVTDQNGSPIANAPVILWTDGAASPTYTPATTDSKGQATFTGLTGSADGTKYDIAVDVNGDGAYTNGTDYRTQVTVSSYTATLKTLSVTSDKTLGNAFDADEYDSATNGITVTAKDQNNNTTAVPATVVGQWTITPFDSTVAASTEAAVINSDGTVDSPYTSVDGTYTLNVWNETDGTPGESAGDTKAAALTVKIGQATVEFDKSHVQTAPASTLNDSGKLVLADGTALPGRELSFSLTPGDGDSNAQFVPAANSDTDSTTAITRTTDASGAFSFQVKDPAVAAGSTQGEESGVEVTGSGTAFTPATTQTIDFVSTAVDTVDATAAAGPEGQNSDGAPTPGRPEAFTFTVTNANEKPLANQTVNISVNNSGFLTEVDSDGNLVPATTPTADTALVGAWKNDGASKAYTTDGSGQVTVYVAEEKNSDFDNDGQAKVGVTATVGGKSVTKNVVFESADPLNIGTAKLVYGVDSESSALPKAQFGTDEYVAAEVTDQFGNLVQGVPVSLTDTDSSDQASFDANTIYSSTTNGDAGSTTSTDSDTDEETTASNVSESQVSVANDGYVGDSLTQTVKGTATYANGTKYDDSDAVKDGFQYAPTTRHTVAETVDAGSLEFDWYAADATKATVTAAHTPAGKPVAPGTLVTETITVKDSAGVPVKDGSVEVFLTGTGNPFYDGQGQDATNNGDGTYSITFQGPQSGTVTVQAQAKDADGTVLGQTASDSVTFGKATAAPKAPVFKGAAGAKSVGKKDVLTFKVANANGKIVKLVKGGKVIAKGKVKAGKVVFRVKDTNGKKFTRYVAKIAGKTKAVRVK